MQLLKCFLGWRSYARYEQSETTGMDGGGSKSAISYLDVIDHSSYDNGPQALSYVNTIDGEEEGVRRQKFKLQQIVGRYTPGCEGNKSTPALSYINTE